MMIEPVHCGSSSILKVRFLGHPVYLMGSYSSSNYCSGVPDLAKEWLGRQKDALEARRGNNPNSTKLCSSTSYRSGRCHRGEVMPAQDDSCRVGVCGARRGEGGKKRRKVVSREYPAI